MEDFERTWRLIREQLLDQASGAQPRAVSSRRTLFGIRSSVEEKMDRFAREIEEEQRAKRDAESGITTPTPQRRQSAGPDSATGQVLRNGAPAPEQTRPATPPPGDVAEQNGAEHIERTERARHPG